jgi:hypothetical protein
MLCQLPELGKYFYRYDNNTCRFIPSPKVMAEYPDL